MISTVNSKWRIAAVILAIVALGQGMELFRIKSALKNIFYYDVKVTVKDKNSGEIIEGGTTHGPSTSSEDVFQQSNSMGYGMKSRQISGVAYEPRVFGFSADGYKRTDVEITDDAKSSIVVELEPKPPNAEQASAGNPLDAQ